jgi:hypothetical protein
MGDLLADPGRALTSRCYEGGGAVIFFFNRRAYGRVEVFEGTFVVTTFWCVNLLPLFPRGAHLVLGRPGAAAEQWTTVPVPSHGGSIAAGYLRVWGAFAAAGSLVALLLSGTDAERARALAVGVTSALACAAAWLLIGRVGAADRARRRVYREVTGVPVDPAWLPEEQRRELGAKLRAELGARTPALASATYREAPVAAWQDAVSDPAVTDQDFVRRALVLARIEWRGAMREERVRLERASKEAWAKCR